VFAILRNRRRRRILSSESIPEALWKPVAARTPALARLDAGSLARLRDLALLFLHEKQIVGAGGLQVDEAMRVRIAALACLPILELGIDSYRDFVTVIVYPSEFVVRGREHTDDDGVVHVGDDVLSGEAWDRGPVVLAWRDVEASGRGDGYNVVAHELAHKLDLLDGAVNGIPPLHAGMRVSEWTATFRAAYDDLVARLDRGERTWLDPYAAENPGEFFAVCTEMFFDVPDELASEYPALYGQLARFFKQNPASRPVH
jgi:Mlc titration factor MtfA (ptsG expression regulator)